MPAFGTGKHGFSESSRGAYHARGGSACPLVAKYTSERAYLDLHRTDRSAPILDALHLAMDRN